MSGVKHYIFLGTGKANQIGIFSFDGPPEDDDGEPVYVSAKDYATLEAERDRLKVELQKLGDHTNE